MPKVLGLIPARGGSKGLPGKNLLPLGGRPLLDWTIEAALNARCLDRVLVSTDSEAIRAQALRSGAEAPFLRPAELATDVSPALDTVLHALAELDAEGYRPDIVVLLQPTSPFRTAAHIDRALEIMDETSADSVVSVCVIEHTKRPHSAMVLEHGLLKPFAEYDEKKNIRQLKSLAYFRNGGVYAVQTDCLVNEKSLFGRTTAPLVMNRADSVDIDDALDLRLAQALLEDRASGRVSDLGQVPNQNPHTGRTK